MRLALTIQGARAFAVVPSRSTLRRWIGYALERDARLTLRFAGTAEARHLNRRYRGRDHATNVLTFEYAVAPIVIADIVVCIPVLAREAREQRKPLRDHLAHLIVHGTLHAQGFDHRRGSDARRMQRREIELLARLGIPDPYSSR